MRLAPITKIYDMHCHAYEFDTGEIADILENAPNIRIVAVSDDLESFYKTLELHDLFPEKIIPCAGFHPWNIGKRSLQEVDEVIRQAYKNGIHCIGEIGLDKKFVDPNTWPAQQAIFTRFLQVANELDAYVTVHSPYAWREALTLMVEIGVENAMFHWYTGPLDLIDEIISSGYYISINPALKIQSKHRRVAEHTPLEHMVFESDGPYNYRGLRLSPLMIYETIEEVASLKKVSVDTVLSHASLNSERLLYG